MECIKQKNPEILANIDFPKISEKKNNAADRNRTVLLNLKY